MKQTISGFVYEVQFSWDLEPRYVMMLSENAGDEVYTLIGPASFDYEIPATFNPVAQKLAALEAGKEQALQDYLRTKAMFEEKISKLQCLEAS